MPVITGPVAVRDFLFEMRRRRHSEPTTCRIAYDYPVQFFSISPACKVPIATED